NNMEDPANLQEKLLEILQSIKHTLITEHDSLFVDIVEDLIKKVRLFGCYFATLDIRQDSRILRKVFNYCTEQKEIESAIDKGYEEFSEDDKLESLHFNEADFHCPEDADSMTKDTLNTIRLMKQIQY